MMFCSYNTESMRNILLLQTLLLAAISLTAAPKITQAHKDRAAALVAQMTLEEKIELIKEGTK